MDGDYYLYVHPLNYIRLTRGYLIRDSRTGEKNQFYLDEQTQADYYGWGING